MKISSLPDAGGMACAGLCVAHCLLTPALLVTFASIPWLEGLELLFIACSTLAALSVTLSKKRSKHIAGIWLGITGLVTALLLEEHWPNAVYLLYVSSVLLITSHFLNLRDRARVDAFYK